MINLGVYTVIVVLILVFYLIGIGVHGYIKKDFNDIIESIKDLKKVKICRPPAIQFI